jgi:histone acetyltransferase (RNA polymerase elongator complex component)
MESYMETIREAPEGSVVTFSSYPGDFGGERGANLADFLLRWPIGTIELGTPSLDPRVLCICGRDDDPEDVKKNIAFLRDAGFHLGMQTMIGLPGQSFDSAQSDITALASLMRDAKPPVWDLRIYPCLVLEGTPLEAMFDRGEYVPLPLEEAVIETGKLLITAEREGFRVIRVGLLESRSLKSGVKAGPYHPSFGELALSEKLALLLVKMAPEGPWEIDSKRVSQLLGHARRGLRRMSQLTGIPEKIILNRLILI